MTKDEAKKVCQAIGDGCGFADADVGSKILGQLIEELPDVPWLEISAEIEAECQ